MSVTIQIGTMLYRLAPTNFIIIINSLTILNFCFESGFELKYHEY